MLIITVLAGALLSTPSPSMPPDPCALIARAEAQSLLGQALTEVTPAGPEEDEESGGTLVYCTYRAGKAGLIVSVVEFRSADDARRQTSKALAAGSGDDGPNQAIVSEAGIGQLAYWGTSKAGAEFVVVQGKRVLSLGLGGKLSKPLGDYHAPLRALAASAIAKL